MSTMHFEEMEVSGSTNVSSYHHDAFCAAVSCFLPSIIKVNVITRPCQRDSNSELQCIRETCQHYYASL